MYECIVVAPKLNGDLIDAFMFRKGTNQGGNEHHVTTAT